MRHIGPKDWSPGKLRKRLKTPALDNHGYRYQVTLNFIKDSGKWSLSIDGTPASWYMSTLLERPIQSSRISIDFGQKWDCINFGEILAEAVTLI